MSQQNTIQPTVPPHTYMTCIHRNKTVRIDVVGTNLQYASSNIRALTVHLDLKYRLVIYMYMLSSHRDEVANWQLLWILETWLRLHPVQFISKLTLLRILRVQLGIYLVMIRALILQQIVLTSNWQVWTTKNLWSKMVCYSRCLPIVNQTLHIPRPASFALSFRSLMPDTPC